MTKLALGLSSLVVALSACGVDAEDLPEEFEDAICDYLVRCNAVQDSRTCHDAMQTELGTLLAAIDDGTVKYDDDAAADCLDVYGDLACTYGDLADGDTGDCSNVFTGTVPTGGMCLIDEQCANGGDCERTNPNCDPDTACCVGTCEGTRTESPLGGPCNNDLNFCGPDAFCQTSGPGPGICQPEVTMEGASCMNAQCSPPLFCDSGAGRTNTCRRPAASGASCFLTDRIPCLDIRDYCDMTTTKCTRRIAVGGTCGQGLPCVSYASCVGGTCLADLPAGSPCVDDQGADCAGDLNCTNGTCQLPPPEPTCSLGA